MQHRARKRFGQNFLHDQSVILNIVNTINPQKTDNMVEIGPGQGAITTQLLDRIKKLQAIELDRDLLDPLAKKCANHGDLKLHNADALKFDFSALRTNTEKLRIVGNLPYNISTPILFHLLSQASDVQDMHFMLQKEVVDRMSAAPGSKVYGRLSVILQAQCEVTPLFVIPPQAFNPAPKVDSAFVRIRPYETSPYAIKDFQHFTALVKQAFSQRRKTLRNTLKELVNAEQFAAADIDPGKRAEVLSITDFVRLADSCKP